MMLSKIPRKVSFLKPVLPLVPEEVDKTEETKSKFVTMELKSQAGATTGGTYKKLIALFKEGTPQEWIDIQRDIAEVWTQNSITQAADRMAIVKALLKGETLTTFEASIEEQKQSPAEAMTMDMVTQALAEVSTTISPQSPRKPKTVDEEESQEASRAFYLSNFSCTEQAEQLSSLLPWRR